jgi:hypothetical protein
MKSHRESGRDPWLDFLLPGETVRWIGRPDTTRLFTQQDWYLVPFGLVWAGFAVVWESAAVAGGAPIFFWLWGIPFVLMGCYITVGRFFLKASQNRRTWYVVTDRRVLRILCSDATDQVEALFLQSLPTVSTRANADGRGTLQFESVARFGAGWYGNTGMDLFTRGRTPLAFYDVPDVQNVAALISDLVARSRSN